MATPVGQSGTSQRVEPLTTTKAWNALSRHYQAVRQVRGRTRPRDRHEDVRSLRAASRASAKVWFRAGPCHCHSQRTARTTLARRVPRLMSGPPYDSRMARVSRNASIPCGGEFAIILIDTSKILSLDNGERQSAVLKADRDRFSGDTAAEAHDVELLGQVRNLRRCRLKHCDRRRSIGRSCRSILWYGFAKSDEPGRETLCALAVSASAKCGGRASRPS